MTLLPMPTVIVIGLDTADGPPRKPAQQHVVPINHAERSRPSLCIVDGHRRPMQSSIAACTGGQTAHCSLPPREPAPDRGYARATMTSKLCPHSPLATVQHH